MNDKKLPEIIEKVALAALLHDIGKFIAKTNGEKLQNESENNQKISHASLSKEFIEKFIGDQELIAWVSTHHDSNPESVEAKIIKLANCLSSGEQIQTKPESEPPSEPQTDSLLENIFDNLTLETKESNSTNNPSHEKSYFQLSEYPTFDDNFLPKESLQTIKNEYKDLWQKFIQDLKTLSGSENQKLNLPYTTWLTLIRKYTNRFPYIPSNSNAPTSDISLYQHSRIASAIASCLTYSLKQGTIKPEDIDNFINIWNNGNIPKQECDKNSTESNSPELATFLCGDVSGIQEYIYSIPTKGAAKQLKARSFLIQLLCEFIANYICEYFSMPPCNIIYSSGGRFFILLPCNEKEKIKEIRATVSAQLLESLKGNLHLLLATTPVHLNHFAIGEFTKVWSNVTHEISIEKNQKYSIFSANKHKEIFGPFDKDKYPVTAITASTQAEEEDADLEQIARQLRNAKWMVRTKVTGIIETNPEALEFINTLNYNYQFINDTHHLLNLLNEIFEKNIDIVEVIALNTLDIKNLPEQIIEKILTHKIPINFRVYANYWPTLKENYDAKPREFKKFENESDKEYKERIEHKNFFPALFEHLAEVATGPEKIAIFRADVDSLGNIFAKGLKNNNTLSRSAMLSSALSDFFEGYVNYLAKNQKYKGYIGIIYSGGDDLFIVGAWNKVFDFAFDLQSKFKKYTNNHLSLSGGIIVIDHTLPIRLSAKMAETAETLAKSYKRRTNNGANKEKDAIVIFDTPLGYEEFSTDETANKHCPLYKIKQNLIDIHDKANHENFPFKGLLHKLFDIANVYEKQKQLIKKRKMSGISLVEIEKEVALERWKWLLSYSLRKYTKEDKKSKQNTRESSEEKVISPEEDNEKTNEIINKKIKEIQDILLSDEYKTYKIEDKLSAILRWLEFLTREKKVNTN